MLSSYERMVAWRYLKPRRGEGFMFVVVGFSIIGIMLGVGALVAVMTVMNGFRTELLDKIIGVNGHALIIGYDGKINNWKPLLDDVKNTPNVIKAMPMIERQLMGSHASRSSGIIVRGLPAEDIESNPLMKSSVIAGNLKNFTNGESVVAVGSGLADQLSLKIGDSITLISPEGQVTPFGTTPRIAAFKVIAIVQVGISDYDKAFVFMPLASAQNFFDLGNAVGGIDIISNDADTIEQTIAPLKVKIPAYGQIYTWKIVNKSLFDALQVEQLVMFFIVSIIMLVAAFNIVSSLIMLVQSKTKDIAILRTMGAERKAMLRLFMLSGTTIGLIGIISGFGFGFLLLTFRNNLATIISRATGYNVFDPNVYFLSELPARYNWHQLSGIFILSLLLTILATIYPSWKAASTDPVTVLRYD